MRLFYNLISGKNAERLEGLSDGIFAVAMTILTLDLRPPHLQGAETDTALLHALTQSLPQFGMYFVSFMTLGIFWNGQQVQLNVLQRSDRTLTSIHILFLAIACLLPYVTQLLAEHPELRVALVAYWLVIFLLGVLLFASWIYAKRRGLVKEEVMEKPEIDAIIKKRIIGAQALYAFGALLCVFGNQYSIGFILLVQLNYAFSPPLPILSRL